MLDRALSFYSLCLSFLTRPVQGCPMNSLSGVRSRECISGCSAGWTLGGSRNSGAEDMIRVVVKGAAREKDLGELKVTLRMLLGNFSRVGISTVGFRGREIWGGVDIWGVR